MTTPTHAPAKPAAQVSHAAMLAALRASGRDLDRMTVEEIVASFTDRSAIDAAAEKHQKAEARLAEAADALRAAKAAHAAARERKRCAVDGVSGECPLACAQAEREAADVLDVRQQVHVAAEHAVAAAVRGMDEGRAVAHRPVAIETIRRRVLAVAKGARARAMMAEAEADWRRANALQGIIVAIGTGWPLGNMTDNTGMPLAPWTMEDELSRWDGSPHRPGWWDGDVRAFLAEAGE